MGGFLSGQTAGDLGQLDVVEGRNDAEICVCRTELKTRGETEHVVFGLQLIGLQRLLVVRHGLLRDRRATQLADRGNERIAVSFVIVLELRRGLHVRR